MANINFKGNGHIDFDGIRKLLDSMKDECRLCKHNERKKLGTLCDGCCMRSNSTYTGDGSKRSRVYPSSIFKQFGLINLPAMGKHMFYWFLDRPWLNFTYPQLPAKDLWGGVNINTNYNPAIKGKHFLWHIHHENEEFWNDSEWNTMLCLNTEHPKFSSQNKD